MTDATAAPEAPPMPGEGDTSTEITRRAPAQAGALALLTDDEIRRLWRVGSALASSGLFKDSRQAEQAFAKMVVGRDLGLTPAQAMAGLHVIEGKVEVAAVMLAQFVRGREGYDYTVDVLTNDECSITFTVDGAARGTSTFTRADAETAGLLKNPDKPHTKFPRNMLYARCMSNGVKWFVPEVLGGLPVYHDGELPRGGDAIDAGEGSGEAPGIDLGPDVEAVLARAADLGHAQLADRATAEMTLGHQPPGAWVRWVRDATAELDRVEASMADAEVVQADAPGSSESAVSSENADVVQAVAQDDPEAEDALDRLLRQREALQARLEGEADDEARAGLSAELDGLDEAVAELCPHLTYDASEDPPRCTRCGAPLGSDQDELPL